MRAEPRLRVFSIRVNHEPWIGREVAGRPFPDVADHLAAAELAVTRGMIRDVAATRTVAVKLGPHPPSPPFPRGGKWRFVAPGETALGSGQIVAARCRCRFPLGLGRQA